MHNRSSFFSRPQHGKGEHMWKKVRPLGSQYVMHNRYVGDWVNGCRQGYGDFFYARYLLRKGG